MTAQTLTVQILAFDGVEALDFAGPYEVFTTASRMQQRTAPEAPPVFEVNCIARTLDPIRARAGMAVIPSHSFADAPPIDVLIVPGGVVDQAMRCA